MKHYFYLLITFAVFFEMSANSSAQWIPTNGANHKQILSLAANGTNIFVGVDGGIFRSTDEGLTWMNADSGLTGNTLVSALALNGVNLFAASYYNGGVFISTDSGTNWRVINTGLTNLRAHALAISETTLFVGTEGGVFGSTDNGTIWSAMNNGLTNAAFVRAIVAEDTNVFVGVDSNVFRSTNNGVSWTQVDSGLKVSLVNTLLLNGTTLFAGTDKGVFRSTDNGNTWIQAGKGFLDSIVFTLAMNGINLFAGTNLGVFRSIDGGQSWAQINDGLSGTDIVVLTTNAENLYAGNDYHGVWEFPLNKLTVISNPVRSLSHIILSPNPSNGEGVISYHLDERSNVRIKVYNRLGEVIEILVDAVEQSGNQSNPFDLSKHPSGIYFISLQTEKTFGVQSLSLMK